MKKQDWMANGLALAVQEAIPRAREGGATMGTHTKATAVLLGAILVTMLAPVHSDAGLGKDFEVYIDASKSYAGGSVGNTRGSSDPDQYIGCSQMSWAQKSANEPPGSMIFCQARDRLGKYASCVYYGTTVLSTDLVSDDRIQRAAEFLKFAQPVYAINAASYVEFSWGGWGECKWLQVSNYSYFQPRYTETGGGAVSGRFIGYDPSKEEAIFYAKPGHFTKPDAIGTYLLDGLKPGDQEITLLRPHEGPMTRKVKVLPDSTVMGIDFVDFNGPIPGPILPTPIHRQTPILLPTPNVGP